MTTRGKKILRRVLIGLAIVAVIGGWAVWYNFFRTHAQPAWVTQTARNHFLYGSIGQEGVEGVPYWIYIVLPKVFPEYLPAPGGYAALGMSWEPGPAGKNDPPHELPIGVTRKFIGFDRAGLNCAFCHVSRVRLSPEQAIPNYYVGGPAHVFRVQDYQWFLFRSAADPRFNSANLMAAISGVTKLSLRERILYRFILIPATRSAILKQRDEFRWQFTHNRPPQGPGQVDPFNPVRFRFFHEKDDGAIGNADIPSIWNQKDRVGGRLHWDGLSGKFSEVAISSAIGDGARGGYLDLASLKKIENYLMNLPPPKYPLPIDAALAAQGKPVYDVHCAQCHRKGGQFTLQPIALNVIKTDPHRARQWTQSQVDSWKNWVKEYQFKYGATWNFDTFANNDGYVAVLLDGVWLRGPYLHNGSVPSLRDLLNPVAQRPKKFYRGYDLLDGRNVGFVSNVPRVGGTPFVEFDTTLPGLSNVGHEYGTTLSAPEKEALLEYLKTL